MMESGSFYFQWPWALLLFSLLPFVIGVYLLQERKRWQTALRFSYGSVLEHLKLNPAPWRKILQPLCLLGVMTLLIIAVARPTITVRVPVRSVDMMLVMDISLSMMAEDLKPNRMMAARDAAIRFVGSLPQDVRIGLEFFAGNTFVVTPPTRDHHKVVAYLNSLKMSDLQQRTEIGSAIQTALKIFEGNKVSDSADAPETGEPQPDQKQESKPPQKVILLLSDGDSREGYPWNQAALNAKEQNVFIYTVGIGSDAPTTIHYQDQELPVTFSEETLKQIAELSDGEFLRVFREADFKTIYERVRDQSIEYEERPEEFSGLFSLLALGMLMFGMLVSLVQGRRFP